jgi:hypothetical protein
MTRYRPYAAVAVIAVATAFVWPLTSAVPARTILTARLASAVAATVVCIAFAMWTAPGRRTTSVISVVCGVVGLALLLTHFDAQARCIAGYEGRPVVVGTVYLPDTQIYIRDNPDHSPDGLLEDAAGVAERVWTADSVRACALRVTWPGVGAIPFLAASISVLLRRRSYGLAAHTATTASPVSVQTVAPVYDAFLSYRHVEPDRSIAFELVETLEREGLRLAIDVRDFSPNEHFLSEMERCIKESRLVLCVITAHYVLSDHTSEEALISKTLDLAERRRRLVPLIYERVELPVWLHGLVGIDFTPAANVDPHARLVQLLKRS